MKCPNCSVSVTRTKFCPECGKELDMGLSEDQKNYLQGKRTGHAVKAIAGGIVGSTGIVLGIFSIIGGILLILFGILLTLTLIGAIIGIPMIVAGAGMLGIGGASTVAGGVTTGVALHSAKKRGEIEDQLQGVKR